jgi:hypothetical protein
MKRKTMKRKARPHASKKPVRRKFELPKAFRITPMKLKGRAKKHAHVFGAEALPPCPAGSIYVDTVTVNHRKFCVYRDEIGLFTIDCGPA